MCLNELVIAIDWSGCCGKENYLLRACLFSKVKRGQTKYLGFGELGKKSKTAVRGLFIAYFSLCKGRKVTKVRFPEANKKLGQMNSEPWILITNLHQHPVASSYSKPTMASFCVNLYAKRMQIEQNFRDDKSTVSCLN